MDGLNTELIAKTLGYHGLPLQKAWEEERGSTDLKRLGLANVDYSEYFARQKNLSFSDRTKRLRLHQFICKKASVLYDDNLNESYSPLIYKDKQPDGAYAVTPPFEVFGNLDLTKRTIHFFENGQPGDIVYGVVISKANYGIIIKLFCCTGSSSRYLTDLNIKAAVSSTNLTGAIDKKNITRGYMIGDNVCCEILEIYRDTNKLVCGMRGTYDRFDEGPAYGLVTIDELPPFYKICVDRQEKEEPFNDILHASVNFNNPACIENLMLECDLDPHDYYTNMSSLRGRFPQDEYANELRQAQASKWAFRSVAEGIEHFKESRHTEAFQCLNKALNIDPRNVEGLVARGALYANSGSFKKAVADFEFALQLNPSHSNARKYMGETLVALGRSFEEEGKNEEARKAYVDCLKIIPTHEEAKSSLDYLKSKTSGGIKMIVKPDELQLPPLNIDSNSKMMHGDHDAKKDDSKKEKKSKKDKKKRNKKRHSSSSESSSESTNSSDSSSESSAESSDSSSSSDSNSNSRQKKKNKKKDKNEHQKSLSPLSKRMNDVGNVVDPSSSFQFNQFDPQPSHHFSNVDDYEMKVRKFIDMPRDEEDYEEKVRLFVAQASKYQKEQKERKHLEDKSIKKKKKKEERKLKKDSKKKRKKDEKRQKKSRKEKSDMDGIDRIENKKIRDALKLFESLPVLDELGSKLTEYYSKVDKPDDKTSMLKKKMQESLYDKEDDLGGKWKMMFSKDERTNEQISKTKQPKQYAFGYESEEDDQRASQNQPHASYGAVGVQATTSHLLQQPSTSSSVAFQRSKSKGRHVSPPPKPKDLAPISSNQVKSGPVVLDKFGNFRLANTEPLVKLPERGRSRSRKYDSSSSASRSPRRRSRSGSYGGRRKYSRSRSPYYRGSRSRSYSRSRSRSRSGGRRFNRSFRGGRGATNNFNDRGNYYKPRFGNSRGRSRGGAPGNGSGYRDNYRDNNFRGRGGRDRSPFRPRARGNGSRYQGPRRSRSFSVERARSQEANPNKSFENPDRDRKPKSPPIHHGPVLVDGREVGERPDRAVRGRSERPERQSFEDTDKVLDKARKDKKLDMLERNKDLVKKPASTATSNW